MTEVEDLDVHHDGYPTHRRKVRFDWSNTPLHWVHQVVLDHLAEQGIDTKPYIGMLRKWLSTGVNQHPGWPTRLQRWWLYRRLADVAALEHFTAVLGQFLIQSRGLDDAGADPVMLDLLRWHGAEEVEHRSLVFDVYQNVCGSYPLRALAMLVNAPGFLFAWLAGVRFLMAHDPTTTAKPRLRDWRRAARQGRVPGAWNMVMACTLRYLRPSHHPSTEASTQMAMDYLAQSPAAQAAHQAAQAARRSRSAENDASEHPA
jgi:predicted metal-dependent hydrolase